uniref:Uncharacterized protein n=1 Tax=Anguilla anguilla TaxID=7936 RepID=A0A0E9U5P5_ANGAN
MKLPDHIWNVFWGRLADNQTLLMFFSVGSECSEFIVVDLFP